MTTLPPKLVEFRTELEAAIARELARRHARRRAVTVKTAVLAAVATVAVVAAGATRDLTGQGPSIVERAAAALATPPESILHIRMTATQDNGDGTSVSWQSESWQATYPPRPRRQIERFGSELAAETASSGAGIVEVYDPASQTVFVASESELVEGVQPQQAPTPKTARGNARPTAEPWDDRPAVEQLEFDGSAESLRKQVRELLAAGRGSIQRGVRAGDREAVRITFAAGRISYLVDADTYAPIELRTRGTAASVVLRFPVYEVLPATEANRALLRLVAQHPDARVVRDAAAFRAAQARLLPHG